jgi:hypothetical protein
MKVLKILFVSGICLLGGSHEEPMGVNFKDSASYRWLNKKVLESRLLDDMENLNNWIPFTTGAPEVVDARVDSKITDVNRIVSKINLTHERSRDGGQSLQMRIPSKLNVPGAKSGRGWGSTGVRRHFGNDDWRKYNRISFWVYPDCPGFKVVSMELRIYNEGVERLPALFGQEGENTLVMQNHEWNHIVWEIGNVARDKVTRLEFSCLMSGNEPEASDSLTYYFDRLELERVEPDYIEGWAVWPGRISYSHTGYQSGAMKSAIASGLDAREFRLINYHTGTEVLVKPVQTVKTHLGQFQVMDFSEVSKQGTYILEAGGTFTQAFRIDPYVWRETVMKAINFFYSERCGIEIPGVHGICHRDWIVVHGDKKIVINGGWHDAGDLTQGLSNTAEAVYGMFSLAERLYTRSEDPELYNRLVEEARWGLNWILKTSFGDGYRNQGSVSSRWTNGIIGDDDDLISTARNNPMSNFTASASEAIAYRVLKETDPSLASYSLRMAEADWRFAIEGMAETRPSKELWQGSFDSGGVMFDEASAGVIASVDLWKATGKKQYMDKAVEFASLILNSQERIRPDWDIPFLGFLYTDQNKDRILHYCHRGREHTPILAITSLCEAFPNHPDWMKWYSAAALYAEYLKSTARYTEPYGVIPASIYRNDEYLTVPENRRESFRKQVLEGIPLGKGHFLRLFPVWMDYRGHFGTILPQALALASIAHLRGDLEAATLSQHQLEWIIGRNPFSQSTMYGEGYDFPPLYAPLPGDLTGALPVGIQTCGENDVPYWPVQNTWTYKEIWTHPVACWIWLMRDLAGPALIEGQASSTVEFTENTSGEQIVVNTNPVTGIFRVMLPEGNYTILSNGQEYKKQVLPGGIYNLDLRPGQALDFDVTGITSINGRVTVKLTARGNGSHHFIIRTDNLKITDIQKDLILKSGQTVILEWHGSIISKETPWIAVVIPDDNILLKKEVFGTTW